MNYLLIAKCFAVKEEIDNFVSAVKATKTLTNYSITNIMSSDGGNKFIAIIALLCMPVVIWFIWELLSFFLSEIVYLFCNDVDAADKLGKVLSGILVGIGTIALVYSLVKDK